MNMPADTVTARVARCACGEVGLTLAGEPHLHGVCHCLDCKRRTGSEFGISAYFERSQLRAQRGETRVYELEHASGSHRQRRHFCPRCGSTVFWYLSHKPEWLGVAGGCFADQGRWLMTPQFSVSHQRCEPWLGLPQAWPRHSD